MNDTKNLFLAIGLSILVLVGWQYFFAAPKLEKQRAEIAQQQSLPQRPGAESEAVAPAPQGAGPSTAPTSAPTAARTREDALAASPRVAIDTPSVEGSIALKGARIDDLRLKKYRETIDPKSPIITLLSPSGSPEPYYVELGYVPAAGAKTALPGADTLWTAQGDRLTPSTPLELTWDNGGGLVFHRKIAIDDDYMFTVNDTVENKGAAPVTLYPFSLVSRHGTPPTSGYSALHEGLIADVGNSGVQEYTYAKIEKETNGQKSWNGVGGWVGFTDKYWAAAVAPDQKTPFDGRLSGSGATPAQKSYQADVLGPARTIDPGQSGVETTHVFAGAKVTQLLDRYEQNPGIAHFDLLIDWGWFYFITRPMFRLIDFLYHVLGNFGLAILAVTVIVKLAFFPLANKSYLSMARMKALQPQMKELQERYKDDKVKQQQETMELYKREKVNPVAGCLPMAIQIPVFFSLYKVLFVTIEMRQAPFYGWIRDLSQPDPTNVFNLFGLIPFDPTQIPVFGHFLWLGIWPLIMGVSMWVQMKMNPEATDPVQRQMFAWMPVIFTFMMGSFPAGLVIYWTWNNTLSVLQQWFIMKRAGVKFELWDNLLKTFRRKPA
ncbi:MAG: membrane protein insertase YidC [Hyphomicrobiales bacterium]|nr:membrane protein insertase YidC [Hyphomicrobiales bacterium]